MPSYRTKKREMIMESKKERDMLKQRNKVAAANYRHKKRMEDEYLRERVRQLEYQVAELQQQIHDLQNTSFFAYVPPLPPLHPEEFFNHHIPELDSLI